MDGVVTLIPDLVLYGSRMASGLAVRIRQGRVESVVPVGSTTGEPLVEQLRGRLLIPGTVNCHAHSFQSLGRGLADDQTFFAWRDHAVYHVASRLTAEDIYVGALFAFAEMLLHGVTCVVDFFYINDQGNENAEMVIRAARDLGIRIVLARALYDWEGAPERFRETVDGAARRCADLMGRYRDDPLVAVHPAPHSPHAASPGMIRAGEALAREHGSPFHMHVAEGRYEREMMLSRHGLTPVRFLDSLGVLRENLIAVHAVWVDEGEIALMGERRVGLAYNPSSNMYLGDGVTAVRRMLDAGVRVGLGTDGGCGNSRVSVFDEMRMAALLQKVTLLDSTALAAEDAFTMGTRGGARLLGVPAGEIAPGALADLVALDLDDLSLQPERALVKNIVYSLSPRAIADVWVHGRRVVAGRELVSVPVRVILEKVRTLVARIG